MSLAAAPWPEPALPLIRAMLDTSFVDWPGRVASVLFLGGCNFRCPFCHNHPLVLAPEAFEPVSYDRLRQRLAPLRKWLGGICISGGEPTLDPALPALLTLLKGEGWAVKLDTNGSRPDRLGRLLADGLVDMVAMDVKAPLVQEKYDRCTGTRINLDRIRASIELIQASGIAHEFRMTVLPRFHSEDDVIEWAHRIGDRSLKKIQNFNSRTTLDPALEGENGFSPETFSRLRKMVAANEEEGYGEPI